MTLREKIEARWRAWRDEHNERRRHGREMAFDCARIALESMPCQCTWMRGEETGKCHRCRALAELSAGDGS